MFARETRRRQQNRHMIGIFLFCHSPPSVIPLPSVIPVKTGIHHYFNYLEYRFGKSLDDQHRARPVILGIFPNFPAPLSPCWCRGIFRRNNDRDEAHAVVLDCVLQPLLLQQYCSKIYNTLCSSLGS